jgi:hypothetical protein
MANILTSADAPRDIHDIRDKMYKYLLDGKVVVFSLPRREEVLSATDELSMQYARFFIKREGRSAINITSICHQIREDSKPILASLVKFDLPTPEALFWFRRTFKDFFPLVEHVVSRDDSCKFFSHPLYARQWESLKTLTIAEGPHRHSGLMAEKVFGQTLRTSKQDSAKEWAKSHWHVVKDKGAYRPDEIRSFFSIAQTSVDRIRDTPGRRFQLLCAVYIDEDYDAVVNLDWQGIPVELVTPGLPTERCAGKRAELGWKKKGKGLEKLETDRLNAIDKDPEDFLGEAVAELAMEELLEIPVLARLHFWTQKGHKL